MSETFFGAGAAVLGSPVTVTAYSGPTARLGDSNPMIQIDDLHASVKMPSDVAIAVAVAILERFRCIDQTRALLERLVEDPEPPAPCCDEYENTGTHALDCERRCGTEFCGATAIAVAHWPGKSIRFCDTCLERCQKIAEAMGFAVQTSPLEARRG